MFAYTIYHTAVHTGCVYMIYYANNSVVLVSDCHTGYDIHLMERENIW